MKNPYLNLLSKTWRFARGRRRAFVLVYLLFIVANVLAMLEPIVLAVFLNKLQVTGVENFMDHIWVLLAYPVIELIFWIFHGFGRVIERTNTFFIMENFMNDSFETLSALPLKWHKDHHSGQVMSRIKKGESALKGFVDEGFMYIETVVKFFAALTALFVISVYTGALALVLGSLCLLVIFKFDKVLLGHIRLLNEKLHVFDSAFYDYIGNMRTVITLRLETLAKNQSLKLLRRMFPLWKKHIRVNEVKWFLISMIFGTAIVSMIGTFLWTEVAFGNVVLIGTLAALFQYTEKYMNVFFDLAWKYEHIVRYSADMNSLDPFWSDYERLVKKRDCSLLGRNWRVLEIRGLHFRYEDEKQRKHNMKNVSVRLERGKKVAFVGESGSGKSTLMTLLRGLEEPSKAKVFVDGRRADGFCSFANQVTLMPQDPDIFENTIKYNVTAGISHKVEDLQEILKISRFAPVLKRLPKGLQTDIKERGVNLSGGEKQRLALARGIFAAQDSTIILMDEPTSSVDPKNEVKIYDALFDHFKKACVVSSIHRLNLLPKFDYIYLFDNGQVIGEGSFEDLRDKHPEFKKLWKSYLRTIKEVGKIKQVEDAV